MRVLSSPAGWLAGPGPLTAREVARRKISLHADACGQLMVADPPTSGMVAGGSHG